MRPSHYTHTNSIYILGIATLLSAQGLLNVSQPKIFDLNAPDTTKATAPSIVDNTVTKKEARASKSSVNAVSEGATPPDAVKVNFVEEDVAQEYRLSLDTTEEVSELKSATDTGEVAPRKEAPREEIVFYDGEHNSNVVFGENTDVAYMTLVDSATVSLAGGNVSHATLSDASAVKMQNSARISHIDMMGNSTLIISDESDVTHVALHHSSTVKVSEDSYISNLNLSDRTQGSVLGGTFGFINLVDESQAHIRKMALDGGSFVTPSVSVSGGAVILEEGTELHIYGRSLNFSDGKILGFWIDETPFELPIVIANKDENGLAKIPTALPPEVTFHEIENEVDSAEIDRADLIETKA